MLAKCKFQTSSRAEFCRIGCVILEWQLPRAALPHAAETKMHRTVFLSWGDTFEQCRNVNLPCPNIFAGRVRQHDDGEGGRGARRAAGLAALGQVLGQGGRVGRSRQAAARGLPPVRLQVVVTNANQTVRHIG